MYPHERDCGVGSGIRMLRDGSEVYGTLTLREGPFENERIEITLEDGTVLTNPKEDWCFR